MTRDLGQIVLDDGTGSLRTFYYRHEPLNKDKQGGIWQVKSALPSLAAERLAKDRPPKASVAIQ